MKKQNKKVMVVEDNNHTRFLISAILATLGYEVVEAEDGRKALEKLADKEFASQLSAIFLDVVMPVTCGLDVLSWLRQQEETADMPVLMLTTKDMAEDLIHGYQLGADYYISKPFTREQIKFGLDLVLGEGASKTAS